MSLPAEGLDHEAPALPIGGAALVRLGEAPPLGALSSVFQTESLDLVTMDPSAIYGPAPVPRPVLIVWMPVSSPEELLRAIVAWRDRSEKVHPVALLGCAPERAREVSGSWPPASTISSGRGLATRVQLEFERWRVASSHRFGLPALACGPASFARSRSLCALDRRAIGAPDADRNAAHANSVAANGRTLTREELLDAVWGGDNLEVGMRAVDNLVWRRRKAGDSQIIVTVRGQAFD